MHIVRIYDGEFLFTWSGPVSKWNTGMQPQEQNTDVTRLTEHTS